MRREQLHPEWIVSQLQALTKTEQLPAENLIRSNF